MPLSRKAGIEANVALMKAYEDYQKLAAEGTRFVIAKAQNNDILPLVMWSDWRDWKRRLREVDRELEKFYK